MSGVPADVAGDDNCSVRSVSLTLYGQECACALIYMLSSVDVLLHPSLYENTSDAYYEPYQVDSDSACDIVKNACYSDMQTVLALSSVMQSKPVQTRGPIVPSSTWGRDG